MKRLTPVLASLAVCLLSCTASAITVRLSSAALERTLRKQLFNDPQGRYFLRGHNDAGCYVYAEDPKVSFRDERVVVHVRTRARLGTALHGACLGFSLHTEADVTLVPEADGETIGFHDAQIENLVASRQLSVFLDPFLRRKLPQQMQFNAADLLRKALASSAQTTGFDLSLQTLTIRSMQVSGDALVVEVDGELNVR